MSDDSVAKLANDVVKELKGDASKTDDDVFKWLEGLAQAAEAAERYDDMVIMMQKLVKMKTKAKAALSPDQRNLLSVAYKNVVGAKRSSWRMLNDPQPDLVTKKELVDEYKKIVEDELKDVCNQVLQELKELKDQNKARMDNPKDAEEKKKDHECQVFYLKMIGDYYRYLTEAFSTNADYKTECNKYYSEAMNLAKDNLEATHPTRLGLALNYSVCYFEILNEKGKACELAKSAFDEAIEKLDSLNDVSYKDSTLIMQLLRDNLTIWNQSESGNQDAEETNPDQ